MNLLDVWLCPSLFYIFTTLAHWCTDVWWVGFSMESNVKSVTDLSFLAMLNSTWWYCRRNHDEYLPLFWPGMPIFFMLMMRMQTVLHRRYLCPQEQINESEWEGPWPQQTILTFILTFTDCYPQIFVFPPLMLLSPLNRMMMWPTPFAFLEHIGLIEIFMFVSNNKTYFVKRWKTSL